MNLFNPTKRTELIARLNRLTPESKAKWGKMSVGEMLCHCLDGNKIARKRSRHRKFARIFGSPRRTKLARTNRRLFARFAKTGKRVEKYGFSPNYRMRISQNRRRNRGKSAHQKILSANRQEVFSRV
jgi:hypothetical protein